MYSPVCQSYWLGLLRNIIATPGGTCCRRVYLYLCHLLSQLSLLRIKLLRAMLHLLFECRRLSFELLFLLVKGNLTSLNVSLPNLLMLVHHSDACFNRQSNHLFFLLGSSFPLLLLKSRHF